MTSLVAVAEGVLVATHPFCSITTTVVLGDGDGCLVVDPAVETPAERLVEPPRRNVAGQRPEPAGGEAERRQKRSELREQRAADATPFDGVEQV